MKPQTAKVLQHLLKAGSITNVEANSVLKVRSVSSRIAELMDVNGDYGLGITKETKKDSEGQRYVRYSLPGDERGWARVCLRDAGYSVPAE